MGSKNRGYWAAVKKNWFPSLTVALGCTATIARVMGWLSADQTLVVILILLTFLVTSFLLHLNDNRRTVEYGIRNIRKDISVIKTQITTPTVINYPESNVRTVRDTIEILQYLECRSLQSKKIKQASIDKRRTSHSLSNNYDAVRKQILEAGEIYYQYVGMYDEGEGQRRLNIFSELSSDLHPKAACKFLLKQPISLLNFIVFDSCEVVARQPYSKGETPEYVIIQCRIVAQLFEGYFDRLMQEAEELKYFSENQKNSA